MTEATKRTLIITAAALVAVMICCCGFVALSQSDKDAGGTENRIGTLVTESSTPAVPSPTGSPAPSPEAPAPSPVPAQNPAPQPIEEDPDPEPAHVIVHSGAYCDNPGAIGWTAQGTQMYCKTSNTDARYRWRS